MAKLLLLMEDVQFCKIIYFKKYKMSVFIIAEIGINHNGSLVEAKKMLDSDEYPQGSKNCETCQYLKKRWDVTN